MTNKNTLPEAGIQSAPTHSRAHASTKANPTLAYDRVGSGRPILFVHGLTYDRRMWIPVIDKLRDRYSCINVDLPGHGDSADSSSYDFESVTQRLHALITELNLDRPVVVGHSIGGMLVAYYAAHFPTAGVVTSDQPLRTAGFIQRFQAMRPQLQGPAFNAIWRAIESSFQIDRIPEVNRPFLRSKPRQDIALGYWREVFDCNPEEKQDEFLQLLKKIDTPFTGVFGDEVDRDYVTAVRRTLPQYQAVEIPGSGHFPHLVHPAKFADVVHATAGNFKTT